MLVCKKEGRICEIIRYISIRSYIYIYNIYDEKGNVFFFQLQFGTYRLTFQLDALAILRVRMETSYKTNQFIAARGWVWSTNYGLADVVT